MVFLDFLLFESPPLLAALNVLILLDHSDHIRDYGSAQALACLGLHLQLDVFLADRCPNSDRLPNTDTDHLHVMQLPWRDPVSTPSECIICPRLVVSSSDGG